jgi:hypothetical protein
VVMYLCVRGISEWSCICVRGISEWSCICVLGVYVSGHVFVC